MEKPTTKRSDPSSSTADDRGCDAATEDAWNMTGDLNAMKGQGDRALHAALSREFDAWAEAGRGAEMETGHRPTAEQALAAFPFPRMRTFLDLGCGNGYAVRHAASTMRAGGRALGVDLSKRMLAVARAATDPYAFIRPVYLRGAFHALPFPDDVFDGVFSHEAVYYAPDVDAALAEMGRVLRPGALCVVTMDYYEENEYSHHWPRACGMPMTLDSEAGWCARFLRAGFREVGSTRLFDRGAAPLEVPGEDADDLTRKRHLLKRRWRDEEGTLMVRGLAAGAP